MIDKRFFLDYRRLKETKFKRNTLLSIFQFIMSYKTSKNGKGPECEGHQDKNHHLKAYYEMIRMNFHEKEKDAGVLYPYKDYSKEEHEKVRQRAREEAQLDKNKKDIICKNCKQILKRNEWGYIGDDHVIEGGGASMYSRTYKYGCKWKPEAFQITVYR